MMPVLDRLSAEPIRKQIYRQLKEQILRGALKQGEALASTRQMAGDLGVSRSTIVEVYDMLLAEGFLVSKQGAQSVVAEGVAMPTAQPLAQRDVARERPRIVADFTTGRPDLALFPLMQWQRAMRISAQALAPEQLGYTGPEGYEPLRVEIAGWLSRSRGICVSAEDIFITAGATHALTLLAGLLCNNGACVMLEDPCHKGLYDTLVASHCSMLPVPADDHGIQTELLNPNAQARMIYVTPSHQFPLGGILPAKRRASLIQYARERNIYIVEDDYDSEFRFSGAPISPLYTLDAQRVIYIGTFSKSIFPALRIGFALLPKELQSSWRSLRTHNDVQNPIYDQAALAEFLRSRAFDRHIRAMKNRYAKRRQALVDALYAEFGSTCNVCGDEAGLHLSVEIKGYRFDESFASTCRERGIVLRTMESHCIRKGLHENMLVLGYGHQAPEQNADGVHQLSMLIRENDFCAE